MNRKESGFVAALVGACLIVAGIFGADAPWIFLGGGGVIAAAGLVALGAKGALPLVATGIWLAASVSIPWARLPWNLLVAGILAIALGYTSGSMGSRAVLYEDEEVV